MDPWVTTSVLAATLFVATNVDDLFVLLAFLASPRFRVRHIVLGQFLGISALVLVSVIAALVAIVIPPAYLGLLGLAPIAIGIKQLIERWRGEDDAEAEADAAARADGHGPIFTVAAVTIANGGDNIAVYVPVFAVRSAVDTAVIVAVFAVMTALWCAIAHWLVNHRMIGAPIRRYGRASLPFVLIGLGILIMLEAWKI